MIRRARINSRANFGQPAQHDAPLLLSARPLQARADGVGCSKISLSM
jgi:hypothetical protein